jgi:FtsP/CotA-like multicopper oxidase with cupredoxin domain
MGQCPGTHWYHAHKHGSTAINVYNGMAGVFIIEGDYDDSLVRIYTKLKETEKVLIVQQFAESPNAALGRFGGGAGAQAPYVNGQLQPKITMRRGEIQLWRFVNATVQTVTIAQKFSPAAGNLSSALPEIRQIAQDGVQFRYENFVEQRYLNSQGADPPFITFATGNRMDFLVKAPQESGTYDFNVHEVNSPIDPQKLYLLLQLVVTDESINPPMEFPSEGNYPSFPKFLEDIDVSKIRIRRTLDFGWDRGPFGPPGPKVMIDGRQFLDGRYDQTMVLGDVEEWTLTNSTTLAHPFHIHINPFQVVEIFDPTTGKTYKPGNNFIWRDVIAIPPAVGEVKGYVKIRHRFVDFPGSYVLHCHMLAHEDRGMMQLVRVISPETDLTHH